MEHPIPYPSQSTPINNSISVNTETRPRRHTITRPDSAMALLSDIEDNDDEIEQQETFDRISGILTSLIQEANEAVQGIEKERVQLLRKSTSTTFSKRSSKIPKTLTSTNLARHSSEPKRPRKTRTSHVPSTHVRIPSTSSTNSSASHHSALFSPTSTTSSSSSNSSTSTINLSPTPSLKKSVFRHTTLRPRSCSTLNFPQRRPFTPRSTKRATNHGVEESIKESFQRLDSSIALVDSLSRDLATASSVQPLDTRFTLLLLVPLLHIPHSLITMIFDFCTSPTPTGSLYNRTMTSFSVSSMIFWACLFTFTNLMVDQVAPKQWIANRTRRTSLPGSYIKERGIKRLWIPQSGLIKSPLIKRRNSI
ncbi:hypothetical protein G6F46_004896 [Rhizopus delemar]|uniref:Uncharacterized protein n=3 Tax=Rhizopus TaxID=4842 RepID=I1CAG0_RHIO9|nr:hypothetical protein RO3G_10150 [Rhizopus delemar RA 99-880]KAG1056109.1 hypothetical protein G6F43_001973 [Rhizopus delemar]KAG1542728.1 hypothetical protein G6F51_007105 [Rhizopus arrhizus]KAG1447254.1 hypothetical protein G6F55_011188 [Rhizopus delemar]KAG1496655.1 hypothetical protein G6F54_006316 [Rhizopus delemar]|eukprot:EIE85440.1 hypothetical protein RO3G_10150 [Rhizopus delemar RA 99-880]